MRYGFMYNLRHFILGQIRNLSMKWRRSYKSMNTGPCSMLNRFPTPIDVSKVGSTQATYHRIFLTVWKLPKQPEKSPSDAIGKPASMISTPISSKSSAISSFSVWLIVAPGLCSPSLKVVSNI